MGKVGAVGGVWRVGVYTSSLWVDKIVSTPHAARAGVRVEVEPMGYLPGAARTSTTCGRAFARGWGGSSASLSLCGLISRYIYNKTKIKNE